MKKILLTLFSFLIGFTLHVYSQTSFLFDENMAVFYPAGFDSVQTLPSPAVERDLLPISDIPVDWGIIPVYGTDSGKVTVTINCEEGTDFYATGEVTGHLRRNNTEITLWNTDNYGYRNYGGTRLYQSHPWILGVKPDGTCFGIIADHTWRQKIKLSDAIKITSDGPSFRVIVIKRNNPKEIMKALGNLIGTINLPPLWAIGHQQSRYSYYPDSKVKEIAEQFRQREIPCDVIWMDIDYMDGVRPFTFNKTYFPDPVGLNSYLNSIKFKSIYIIDAGTKQEPGYSVYDRGIAGNHFVKTDSGSIYYGEVWPGLCAFPDYTRPETRAWWKGLQRNFMQCGADGIWNDMNEPAVFGDTIGTMPDNNRHAGGGGLPAGSHLRYHNVYGMLMSMSTYEALLEANPDKRPFVLTRAGFLGGQRYAATWTGDNVSSWEHLKMSIPMSINLGLSGQPFNGPDIGGYVGNATPELFGHWIALGAFYPFSRNHNGEPSEQEPWAFGPEIEKVSQTAIGRRYRLLPYFYTLFREASQTGIPIMRPLFFADPADLSLRDEEQAFMLGDDLIILPRWANDAKLPAGNWKKIKLEDTEDNYQVTVILRPGAVIPMGKLIQSTADYNTEFITLLVNPNEDGTATGTLYDDEGNGFGYRSGDYAMHRFDASKEGDRLKIEITLTEGTRRVNRHYRIGYVTDDEVIYTDYSSDTTQYMDMVNEITGSRRDRTDFTDFLMNAGQKICQMQK
ncbi:MAG: DUF5110 domain-containing protein [Candidatus Azobacteroides sp.]|nr:DUF5110 domain-containing protein [Candidatus Azobacteroides sp.]